MQQKTQRELNLDLKCSYGVGDDAFRWSHPFIATKLFIHTFLTNTFHSFQNIPPANICYNNNVSVFFSNSNYIKRLSGLNIIYLLTYSVIARELELRKITKVNLQY